MIGADLGGDLAGSRDGELSDADAEVMDGETSADGVRDVAGDGLDQVPRARLCDLAGRLPDREVIHRGGDIVGFPDGDVEFDVEQEPLGLGALGIGDAHVAPGFQIADADAGRGHAATIRDLRKKVKGDGGDDPCGIPGRTAPSNVWTPVGLFGKVAAMLMLSWFWECPWGCRVPQFARGARGWVWLAAVSLSLAEADAGLDLSAIGKSYVPPEGRVPIRQTAWDKGGRTSIRNNAARFDLSPTSDGYPDVDTYRDLEFYFEIDLKPSDS